MAKTSGRVLLNALPTILLLMIMAGLVGCTLSVDRARQNFTEFVTPTDVSMIRYHVRQMHKDLKDFTSRLYARNPKYEKDLKARKLKVDFIFRNGSSVYKLYEEKLSHETLTLAFAPESSNEDRVFLLCLGLWKSIREAYVVKDEGLFVSGLQLELQRLQRLHHNISQVNWRLKTYRDSKGQLLFLTNAVGENGYLNMGYEVIMTRILTRIEDDIFMRGGLPEKYIFKMSTLFMSIVI
jgi:hypothetical protein